MEAAGRPVAEANSKLARHRLALEAGADAEVVTAWIREEQAKQTEAQALLRRTPIKTERISRGELIEVIRLVRGKVDLLANADPVPEAKIYAGLGLPRPTAPKQQVWSVTQPTRIDELPRLVRLLLLKLCGPRRSRCGCAIVRRTRAVPGVARRCRCLDARWYRIRRNGRRCRVQTRRRYGAASW
jgi:hypothetical protein